MIARHEDRSAAGGKPSTPLEGDAASASVLLRQHSTPRGEAPAFDLVESFSDVVDTPVVAGRARTPRRTWWGALALALVAGVAGDVCAGSDALVLARVRPRPGTYEDSLLANGIERRFRLHLPSSYNHSRELPVVVLLHDRGGDPRQIESQSRFVSEAERNDLILVVPWGEGVPRDWGGKEDVAFVGRILEAVTARLAVDRQRLVLAGFGTGGTLALEAARQLRDRVAAVVAVSAAPPVHEEEAWEAGPGLVALLLVAGKANPRLPFDDGSDRSQMALAARWAASNGCLPAPQLVPLAEGGFGQLFPDCRDGVDVLVVGVPNGGHAWPGGRAVAGGDPPVPSPSATALIVDFVTRHPRP